MQETQPADRRPVKQAENTGQIRPCSKDLTRTDTTQARDRSETKQNTIENERNNKVEEKSDKKALWKIVIIPDKCEFRTFHLTISA